MVFIALPALQRNQRDTQRKNDMARLNTAIENYKSNNKGSLPSMYTGGPRDGKVFDFVVQYLNADTGEFQDLNGKDYSFMVNQDSTTDNWIPAPYGQYNNTIIFLSMGGFKYDGSTRIKSGGKNNYTVQYNLEGGGVYCIAG